MTLVLSTAFTDSARGSHPDWHLDRWQAESANQRPGIAVLPIRAEIKGTEPGYEKVPIMHV